MSIMLTATFDTRRDAEMVVERLVQEFGLDRGTIFLATEGDSNSAGERADGADVAPGQSSGDEADAAALNGSIVVSITVADQAAAELVRSAYDEFAAAGVVETDPAIS
jgi:hypothetical protein